MLAGNIVQVRLERKALSAAVGPTCCSGREQRSKTAHTGSAISSKARLRKELRAKRRALTPAEHALRSNRAAAAITRLAPFKAGARVAVYLPFDCEIDPAAVVRAARRRGIRIFVPVVVDLRHRRLRFHPLSGRTRRGVFGIAVPHDGRSRWVAPRWFDLIVVPLVGVDGAGDWAWAADSTIEHWRFAEPANDGRVRTWWVSASIVSGPTAYAPRTGTCAWTLWQPNQVSNSFPRASNELLAA